MAATQLPEPPFIDIPGIANFRDVGRYAGINDKVRSGLVYRSADPTKATDSGLKMMSKDLAIAKVYDLRSLSEIKRDGPEWANVEQDQPDPFAAYSISREWIPVFAAEDYGPEQIAIRYKAYTEDSPQGFVRAYKDILKSGTKSYAIIFRHLAQQDAQPCLVHCTAGKDRTGIFVALLLQLVGVDDEEIAREYALTDLGLAHLKPLFVERLLKNPALTGNKQGVLNMVSSKEENMLASLQMIRSDYGGAEAYMRDYCGLSDSEIEAVRQNLLKK